MQGVFFFAYKILEAVSAQGFILAIISKMRYNDRCEKM